MATLDLTKALVTVPYEVFQQVLTERDNAVQEADRLRGMDTDLRVRLESAASELAAMKAQAQSNAAARDDLHNRLVAKHDEVLVLQDKLEKCQASATPA